MGEMSKERIMSFSYIKNPRNHRFPGSDVLIFDMSV